METKTLVIIFGTSFALLLVFLAAIIVISRQKKSAKLQIKSAKLQIKLQSSAHKKHRALARIALETQESERQRIGMELHDGLGPSFVALRINLERINNLLVKVSMVK